MGEMFHACAYDIETMTCYVYYGDKFHAECYSRSGAVMSIHYLLRQKAYRVMWCGEYVVIDDALKYFNREEDLYGLSIFEDYESFARNNADLEEKSYYDKVKFIDEKSKLWEKNNPWELVKNYYRRLGRECVDYSGYLVNHTQKLAIDLAAYYEKSISISRAYQEYAIDLIPVLTETGDGTRMALFDGFSVTTTEELAEEWRGDLMQIVNELPQGYRVIDCCFAGVWDRAAYCYKKYGVDQEDFLLCGKDGKRYQSVPDGASIYKRRKVAEMKVEKTEDYLRFVPVTLIGENAC